MKPVLQPWFFQASYTFSCQEEMGVLAKEQPPVSILALKKPPVWVPTKMFSYSTLSDNQFRKTYFGPSLGFKTNSLLKLTE